MTSPRPIRVLVVDDSALARQAITQALSGDPEIEVVGVAPDAYVAREKILQLSPDMITLDLEMPRMDGLTFLRILQQHHPLPVLVVSSLTPQGSAKAMEALEAGAVDVLGKPNGSQTLGELAYQLAFHVKAVARSRRITSLARPAGSTVAPPREPLPSSPIAPRRIVLIGASTGGVEALRYLLPRLPSGLPPIAVVQHIPAQFSRIMADNLAKLCAFEVREATDGEELRYGLCLIAPGNHHLALVPSPRGYRTRLTQSPPIHHCRPAVDVLFRSGAEHAGRNAVGLLMTGMGSDGARGLLAMRQAGARTLAQDEESCVVFGMPQAAIKVGAVDRVANLQALPQVLLQTLAEPITP
ncbi:MAG: chemotaxis response regulator protein-glutamate methylesterase [Verrucomicrobia bacterium]|nr:chemotaxis response regulator protein-glutamate methylesterase [Verrucomicrobiota bacterium]